MTENKLNFIFNLILYSACNAYYLLQGWWQREPETEYQNNTHAANLGGKEICKKAEREYAPAARAEGEKRKAAAFPMRFL